VEDVEVMEIRPQITVEDVEILEDRGLVTVEDVETSHPLSRRRRGGGES
jgi:hypothetical protein